MPHVLLLAWGATCDPRIHYEKDCQASIALINQLLFKWWCLYHRYFSWKYIHNARIQKVREQPEQLFPLSPCSPTPQKKDALHHSRLEDCGEVWWRLKHLGISIQDTFLPGR